MPPFMIALMNMQIEMFCQFLTASKKMLDVSVSVPTQMAPSLNPIRVVSAAVKDVSASTPMPKAASLKPVPMVTTTLKKGGCVGPADLRS